MGGMMRTEEGEGASYAIGDKHNEGVVGITHMEGLLELYEMNEW